ncbi:MAG: hypothetical protein CL946_04225 [Ectothiorhodospiraceae bacterium]|nr:hypothetical protein [Ectothiorhodospiraceae bacterium]
MYFCNTGSVPITGITITDTIPSGLTGLSIGTVSSGMAATLSGNIVTATLTSPLPPTACRYFEVEFTIDSTATVGSTITNCAWYSFPGGPMQSACASFVVKAPDPDPCLWKDVCNEQPNYLPGDTLRYRLRLQNIGGLPITGATITDILDPNLEYIGNPAFNTTSSWSVPCQTTSNWSGPAISTSGNTVNISLPTIPATCQDIFYGGCGMYGAFGVPFYFIEFDVRVRDTAALGNIPNNFTIAGGTLSSPEISNTDYITVVGTAGFTLDKAVAIDTSSWASSLTTSAGSNVNYRLQLTVAPGSVGLRHITFADLLPRDDGTNDRLILGPCSFRGSMFDVNYLTTVSTAPTASDYSNPLSFANVNTLAPVGAPGPMFVGACGTLGTWSGGVSAGDMNFGYYFGSAPVGAGNSATAVFTGQLSSTAQDQQEACNTFAANAAVRHLINSTTVSDVITGELESGTACVTIGKDTSQTECYRAIPHSVNIVGIDPASGDCQYSVTLSINNPNSSSLNAWFESDAGTVSPNTLSIPPGTSTQTLTFTDTPPTDVFVCIRYGYFDGNNRVLCDSVCFDLPPCGGDGDCDSLEVSLHAVFSSGVNAVGDCEYTVELSMTNAGGSPMNVWFESFQGSVSPAAVTLPSGTSIQTLTFTDTPPTDAFVCIRYGVYSNGQRRVCDSVCFDIMPCGGGSNDCDSIHVDRHNVMSLGVDADGDCEYSVQVTLTNSGSSTYNIWFDSDQGSLSPNTGTLAPGTFAYTLTFTDDPPTDTFVCIRYGIMVNNQRVVCDSICFDLPPCGGSSSLCDSLSVDVTSVVSGGTTPNGECEYTITLNTSNTSAGTLPVWFESFQGTVAPSSLGVPTGTSSQTITFTDTSPSDAFACIRYGVMFNNQRILCDSVCFDLPPCDDTPCDSLIDAYLDTLCCKYNVTIANGVGSPITSISYTISDGTVNSIGTSPCTPVTPAPVGSTSGILTYIPPCSGNMNMSFDITPTTASNNVFVTLVVHHGDRDSCILRFDYNCDRTPLLECDDVKVKPYIPHSKDASGRHFVVFNSKVPASPITHIDIVPSPTPCNLTGSNLKVDLVPTAWSSPYTRIPNSGFISANSTVRFNLEIDYSCNWTGNVMLVIHHADGDSCVYDYGTWKATKPGGGGVVISDTIAGQLYANKLQVEPPSNSPPVKWLSISTYDTTDIIVGGSGMYWQGTVLENGYAELDGYEQGMHDALFSYATPVLSGSRSKYANIVLKRGLTSSGAPVIRWVTYDEDGNAIATDTVSINTTVLSLGGSGGSVPQGFELLHLFPHPAKGTVTVNYALGNAMRIRLDVYNQLGEHIETIDEGYRAQGLRSVHFNTSALPAGTYYCTMKANGTTATKRFQVVK